MTNNNLKPWPKGVSGNPAGRPKLPGLRDAINQCLTEQKDGRTALDAILSALRAKASRGDVRAAEMLFDRAFGKVVQPVDVKTEGTLTVTPPIQWTDDKPDPASTPPVKRSRTKR